MAYLYAALSLKAAGRPVDPAHLRALAAAVGLPADEELFAAIARLAGQSPDRGAVGGDGGEPSGDATGAGDEAPQPAGAGCYVYCLVPAGQTASLGPIGLDGNEVRVVTWSDLGAVVHDQARPPEVSNENAAAHQRVVEAAQERFGSVVPLTFGHVVAGGEAAVLHWLQFSYDDLKRRLEAVRGKIEYGVQVIWDPEAVAARLVEERPGLRRLKEEAQKNRGPGREARQRFQAAMEEEMRILADRYALEYQEILRGVAAAVRPERLRHAGRGLQMIAHFACLVPREDADRLAEAVEERRRRDGLLVRLSGPWPPYSFVA